MVSINAFLFRHNTAPPFCHLVTSDILVLKIISVLGFIQFWFNSFYFSFSFSFAIILVSITVSK